jgi:hypothetical protein
MNRRHRKLPGEAPADDAPADDADVRGEHAYPDRTASANDRSEDDEAQEKRIHYAAGADGTQVVSEPQGAAVPEDQDEP